MSCIQWLQQPGKIIAGLLISLALEVNLVSAEELKKHSDFDTALLVRLSNTPVFNTETDLSEQISDLFQAGIDYKTYLSGLKEGKFTVYEPNSSKRYLYATRVNNTGVFRVPISRGIREARIILYIDESDRITSSIMKIFIK